MARKRTMETILASEYISVGELVRLSEMRYSTLKYYTEEGMLPFLQAEENLTRRYHREESLAQLANIKRLKESGLSIAEIKEKIKQSK